MSLLNTYFTLIISSFFTLWVLYTLWYIGTYKSRKNNPKYWINKTTTQAHDWVTKTYNPLSEPYLNFMEAVEFHQKLHRQMLELKAVQDKAKSAGVILSDESDELPEVDQDNSYDYDSYEPAPNLDIEDDEEPKIVFGDGNEMLESEYKTKYQTLKRHLGLFQNKGKSIVYKNGELTIA